MKKIGKIIATEKVPTTVDEFFFWTDKHLILKPFDVVKVEHIKNSVTFGVVEEISHLTDGASFLAGYISSDFLLIFVLQISICRKTEHNQQTHFVIQYMEQLY